MSGTIWQKFPQLKHPDKVKIYPAQATFTASLSGGLYTFSSSEQTAFVMNGGDIVVIDGITLAANIDALSFSRAISSPFSLAILRGGNSRFVNLSPFKFSAFSQGDGFAGNFDSTGTEDNQEDCIFVLSGVLQQTPDLVGVSSVSIYANANVYLCKSGFTEA